jgi:hypothetical protein
VSDQDFFFDEEPVPEPQKPSKQGRGPAPKPAAQTPARRKGAPVAPTPFFDRSTTYAVALLLAVIGLLVGVLGGYVYGNSAAQPAKTSTPAASSPALQAPTTLPGVVDTGGVTTTP